MITGEIKNKIDKIWDVFYVAGITSRIESLGTDTTSHRDQYAQPSDH